MPNSVRPGKRRSSRYPQLPLPEGFPTELSGLTQSELKLLCLVAFEPFLSLKKTADRLGLNPKTVANRKALIAEKLGLYGHQSVNEYAVKMKEWLEKIGT
jgi:DNA-binding CsgD family transcriptional regulator